NFCAAPSCARFCRRPAAWGCARCRPTSPNISTASSASAASDRSRGRATLRRSGTLEGEALASPKGARMPKPSEQVTYEVVQHDGGWAYKVDGVFSETYPTHAAALKAAQQAAAEQEVPGHT